MPSQNSNFGFDSLCKVLGAKIAAGAMAHANALLSNGHASGTADDSVVDASAPAPASPRARRGAPPARKPASNGKPRKLGAKRSPEELEQVRSNILKAVKSKGDAGARCETIAEIMGCPTKEIALPLRKLAAEGVLETQGVKRATTYFIAS